MALAEACEPVARFLWDEYGGYWEWDKAPERKRDYYRGQAREILDASGLAPAWDALAARLAQAEAELAEVRASRDAELAREIAKTIEAQEAFREVVERVIDGDDTREPARAVALIGRQLDGARAERDRYRKLAGNIGDVLCTNDTHAAKVRAIWALMEANNAG